MRDMIYIYRKVLSLNGLNVREKKRGGRSEMWRTEKEGDGTDGKQKHVHRRRDDPLFFVVVASSSLLLLLPT